MRLRNIKDKDLIINNCSYLIKDYETYKGKWSQLFGNNHPIHLEIGMGKGDFIYQMALKYPQINFIGLEKYSGVLARAIKKHPEALPNLYILNIDAQNLETVFYKEITTIYLNFSDPWPKKRQEKRRLTSPNFLSIYDNIFKETKHIIMKTDNKDLFAYSLVSLSNYGYKFLDINLDLANSAIPNILTEYETKFCQLGIPINYVEAQKK